MTAFAQLAQSVSQWQLAAVESGVGLIQDGEQDGERIGPITVWLHSATLTILQGLLQELWR